MLPGAAGTGGTVLVARGGIEQNALRRAVLWASTPPPPRRGSPRAPPVCKCPPLHQQRAASLCGDQKRRTPITPPPRPTWGGVVGVKTPRPRPAPPDIPLRLLPPTAHPTNTPSPPPPQRQRGALSPAFSPPSSGRGPRGQAEAAAVGLAPMHVDLPPRLRHPG